MENLSPNSPNKDFTHLRTLLFFAMSDLGTRPSKLLGLNFKIGDMRLDTDIPYIYIRAEKDKEMLFEVMNRS